MSEYVARARDVANTSPEVQQIVDVSEEDELMLLGYQANIDQYVHMLKTKEEVER